MRISAKGRYGLSAMIFLAQNENQNRCVAVLAISEKLGISKIYLEQVFALLKKANLVTSIKGANGGYQLSRRADEITAFDILSAIESTLFETTENALPPQASHINSALDTLLWKKLDESVKECLISVSLADLAAQALLNEQKGNFMYFI
ncbi:MAG: Rrf2 family transcriptional regulator [Christensenella sp.]|nr:Rrf2 family transcriptional regulator [Christensenella sp.]